MASSDPPPEEVRPPIRRLGRRRVVSGHPTEAVPGLPNDERPDAETAACAESASHEEWLRQQRPPHWE